MYRNAKSAAGAFAAALLASAMLIAGPATHAAQLAQSSSTQTTTPGSRAAAPSTAPAAEKPVAGTPERVQPGRVEARIADMKKRLMIMPAQEDKWNAFAQVMRDNANGERQLIEQRNQSLRTMTAVDDMKSYEQITQAHADDMSKLTQAFQNLYQSMTPEQQKNADRVFASFAERHAAHEARHAARTTGSTHKVQ